MNIFSYGKTARQKTIMQLVNKDSIGNQDELQHALSKKGFKVGQATLSRDVHELGLVKTGSGYALPEGGLALEAALPSVSRLVWEFVLEVRPAQNLLVIKTTGGSAQPGAAALDAESWPEVGGTIAGAEAVLLVTSDRKAAKLLGVRR